VAEKEIVDFFSHLESTLDPGLSSQSGRVYRNHSQNAERSHFETADDKRPT
jgi:hypothetical protein